MNYLLEVCFVTLTVAISVTCPVAGLSPFATPENSAGAAGTMQRGVSVELPASRNAVPMPDADREDSMVVTVTVDGGVYFGVEPTSPTVLVDTIKNSLSNRTENKLYLKADARTPYANVMKVLGAVRTSGVEDPVLLTAQPDASEPGTLMPPKGLAVLVGRALPPGSEATVVQLFSSGQRWPALKINNKQIPWTSLRSALGRLFQGRGGNVVRVEAEGTLPFADVADVTDTCRSAGAEVVLLVPDL